eukprot:572735-Rhodomonas_salina.1
MSVPDIAYQHMQYRYRTSHSARVGWYRLSPSSSFKRWGERSEAIVGRKSPVAPQLCQYRTSHSTRIHHSYVSTGHRIASAH